MRKFHYNPKTTLRWTNKEKINNVLFGQQPLTETKIVNNNYSEKLLQEEHKYNNTLFSLISIRILKVYQQDICKEAGLRNKTNISNVWFILQSRSKQERKKKTIAWTLREIIKIILQ